MPQEVIFKYLAGALAFLLAFLFRRVFFRLDDLEKQLQQDRQKQEERYQGVLVSLSKIEVINATMTHLSDQIHAMSSQIEKLMEKVK